MPSPSVLSLPSHSCPYPHYQRQLERPDLHFDREAQAWIASRAEVVKAILNSPQFLVRPLSQKVPTNICASKVGEVFFDLIRMNEGAQHQIGKQVIQGVLQSLDFGFVDACIRSVILESQVGGVGSCAGDLNLWIRRFPVSVVAKLCGFADGELAALADQIADFVLALSPTCQAEQIAAGSKAAEALTSRFQELLDTADIDQNIFLQNLQKAAQQAGWQDNAAMLANLVGLLSQTYEASAGLIANCVVALQDDVALRTQLLSQASPHEMNIQEFVEALVHRDPPVQNTRRFVGYDCVFAGVSLRAGDTILLLLAAANLDSSMECLKKPDSTPSSMSFSHGRHVCPGQGLALHIARAGVGHVLEHMPRALWSTLTWTYRPSPNGRLPIFSV